LKRKDSKSLKIFGASLRNKRFQPFPLKSSWYSTTATTNSINEGPLESNNSNTSDLKSLQDFSPKDMKELSVAQFIEVIKKTNSSKENLFDEMTKEEASSLINSIELRVLKEIQVHKHSFTIEDLSALLSFFGQHESGSMKFYIEMDFQVRKIIKECLSKSISLEIKKVGKLIFASTLCNNFNKRYYGNLDVFVRFLLQEKQEFTTQELANFIDSLYLLTRSSGGKAATVKLLLEKCSGSNLGNLSIESLVNLLWIVLLKTRFSQTKQKVHFVIEDIEYKDISESIENLLKELRLKTVEKRFLSLNDFPFSLKFRLRQIGLVFEAIDPKAAIEDPLISVLNTLVPLRLNSKTEASLIHDDVTVCLRAMKFSQVEREKKVLIYPCDLFIPPNKIIEVNGPIHYVGFDNDAGIDDLDGKTLMRYKTLLMHGFEVRAISYKEWYNIKGITSKMEFLGDKIYIDVI